MTQDCTLLRLDLYALRSMTKGTLSDSDAACDQGAAGYWLFRGPAQSIAARLKDPSFPAEVEARSKTWCRLFLQSTSIFVGSHKATLNLLSSFFTELLIQTFSCQLLNRDLADRPA